MNEFAITAAIQRIILNVFLLIGHITLIVPSSPRMRGPAQRIAPNAAAMIGLAVP